MRILSAAWSLQMPPKEIEQPLHAAEVHRGEAPRACRKPGLAFIVSVAPDDLDRLDFDAGEIDGSGRGSAHALRPPTREISAIESAQLGQDHQSTSIFIGRGYEWTFDVTCARRKDFSAFEARAPTPAKQPQAVHVVCVPDAEQLACPSFLRNQVDLLTISIAKHELECVDMPLKQPPQAASCPNQLIAGPRSGTDPLARPLPTSPARPR